jgi:uncharacterized protein YbjT (DUF2867 family)
MILITGATGTIGGTVLRLLAGRGVRLRAMTRDPARLPAGVEAVRADFDDPGSLTPAVAGVESVFLLTAPGASVPAHDLAMIEAADAAGVRKIVKLSAIGGGEPGAGPDTRPSDWHDPGERALAAGEAAWCALRPSGFASNALRWADAIRSGGPVPNLTGSGAQGIVDPRDVAEVAVRALVSDELDGTAPTLTGPAPISVPGQVAVLAEVLGSRIETVDVPPDDARRHMVAAGLDPSVVEVALRGQRLVREGGGNVVTDDVGSILGRPPRTFRAWAQDHRQAFLP